MRDLLLLVIAVLAVTRNAVAEIHEIPTKCPASSGKTIQLAHKHDCTKFYECSNGQKQLSNCPEFAPGQKLHFDPELQNCTFPWEANCASRAPDCSTDEFIQPHPTNCSLYYKCENGEKVLKTCDEEQLFCSDSLECVHKDAAKCKVYDSCPTGKLLEAVLLPHHRQSLYYECVDGQYAVKRCPSGHEFDAERRQCVSNVHCPATGTKRISHETDCGLYYECVDGVKVEKVCEDGLSFDESKGICTWDTPYCMEGERRHHECNCDAYYLCRNGLYQLMKCPSGEKFDWAEKRCMPEDIAECGPSGHNECQGSCSSSSDLLPHRDCNKYCNCRHGTATVVTCPRHMYYDRYRQICNWPEDIRVSDLPTWCDPSDCSFGSENVPHEIYCNKYYKCSGNVKYILTCESGQLFDYTEEKCVDSKYAHCFRRM